MSGFPSDHEIEVEHLQAADVIGRAKLRS